MVLSDRFRTLFYRAVGRGARAIKAQPDHSVTSQNVSLFARRGLGLRPGEDTLGYSLAVGGRPDDVVSGEATTVDLLLQELDRLTPRTGVPLSLPKRIAALALYAGATSGADPDVALQAVVRELGERLPTTPAGLKKAASEARAVLQFGVNWERFAASHHDRGGGGAIPLLHAIAGALDAVNVREVTKARAALFGGGRGGRRHAAPALQTLRAVQVLVERARAGAADAEAELAEVRRLLSVQAGEEFTTAACGGSSRSQPVIVNRGAAA
jgi:hypothetical protein